MIWNITCHNTERTWYGIYIIQYWNQQPSQFTSSLKTSVISDILPLWVWKIHASFNNIEQKE